jgi:thiamine biosynthesis lipoprotein
MVNGGGDMFYSERHGEPAIVGLEHPLDAQTVIGTTELLTGSLCGSAINRRVWGKYNHYLDPDSRTSPRNILAVWVRAESAVAADAFTSCLFFVRPEQLVGETFEYAILYADMRLEQSAGFNATLFTE